MARVDAAALVPDTSASALVDRAHQRLGRTLRGKYRLDRLLGVGGMAAVYLARHRNGNRVALKMLHVELSLDPAIRTRFLREGYVANAVEHPGAVRVLDDDMTEEGEVFLVMELLDGETLDARWERSGRRLGVREVVVLMHQLLDVLGAAHQKGIVHRDVKPENVFLTRDGTIRLLDFGVARLLEGATTATRSGAVFGTPAYMAPEQVLGKTREVDARTDLYGVGASAFTLLSGRYVHEAETPEMMMVLTATRPAPALEGAMPDAPAALARVIDRALMFESKERWPTAKAMQQALAATHLELFGAAVPGTRLRPESFQEEGTTVAPPPAHLESARGVLVDPSGKNTTDRDDQFEATLPADSSGALPASREPLPSVPGAAPTLRLSTIAGFASSSPGTLVMAHSPTGHSKRRRTAIAVGMASGTLAIVTVVLAALLLGTRSTTATIGASAAPSISAPAAVAAASTPEPAASGPASPPASIEPSAPPPAAPPKPPTKRPAVPQRRDPLAP